MTLPIATAPPYRKPVDRRLFIGGSDARVIMGSDEAALTRLWREKRGEAEPPDFSDNLIVQLGLATEPVNRRWFEKATGQVIKDVDNAADLDGRAEHLEKVFAALRASLAVIIGETAQSLPRGTLDGRYLDNLFQDLSADALGVIRNAAEEMREHEIWRAS